MTAKNSKTSYGKSIIRSFSWATIQLLNNDYFRIIFQLFI